MLFKNYTDTMKQGITYSWKKVFACSGFTFVVDLFNSQDMAKKHLVSCVHILCSLSHVSHFRPQWI